MLKRIKRRRHYAIVYLEPGNKINNKDAPSFVIFVEEKMNRNRQAPPYPTAFYMSFGMAIVSCLEGYMIRFCDFAKQSIFFFIQNVCERNGVSSRYRRKNFWATNSPRRTKKYGFGCHMPSETVRCIRWWDIPQGHK